MAAFIRQLYNALIEQGFTEQQSLSMVGMTIQASMTANAPDDDGGGTR